ncbi:hypothetical protein DFS34DRAFT_637911 [Phlyctochytrium arcticum]|nr:hypothetical protein DFS34DRAFT_637911 [Phlyctochytrium arcticum]
MTKYDQEQTPPAGLPPADTNGFRDLESPTLGMMQGWYYLPYRLTKWQWKWAAVSWALGGLSVVVGLCFFLDYTSGTLDSIKVYYIQPGARRLFTECFEFFPLASPSSHFRPPLARLLYLSNYGLLYRILGNSHAIVHVPLHLGTVSFPCPSLYGRSQTGKPSRWFVQLGCRHVCLQPLRSCLGDAWRLHHRHCIVSQYGRTVETG